MIIIYYYTLSADRCYIARRAGGDTTFVYIAGLQCEREDSCLSGPCAHGGACVTLPSGRFSCSCPPGYTGLRCLNDTNECAATPSICQNEGQCINTPGSYKWVIVLFLFKPHLRKKYQMYGCPLLRLREMKCVNLTVSFPKVRVCSGLYWQRLWELLHPLLTFTMSEWWHLPPNLRNQLLMPLPSR